MQPLSLLAGYEKKEPWAKRLVKQAVAALVAARFDIKEEEDGGK